MWTILNLLYLLMLPRKLNIFWSIGFWKDVNRFFSTHSYFYFSPIVAPLSGIVVWTIYSFSDHLVFEKLYFKNVEKIPMIVFSIPFKEGLARFKQSFNLNFFYKLRNACHVWLKPVLWFWKKKSKILKFIHRHIEGQTKRQTGNGSRSKRNQRSSLKL